MESPSMENGRARPRPIQRLPDSSSSLMQASSLVANLEQAVILVVTNSIEAQADLVEVSLNESRIGFTVRDNGKGIDGGQLQESIGTALASSRPDRGSGLGLFALARLSMLEIVSRRDDRRQVFAKVLRGGSCIASGLSNQVHSPGTTVRVSELFYNLPVRKKQLQNRFQKGSSLRRALRRSLQALALMHPEVRWVVEDSDSRQTIFKSSQLGQHIRPSFSGADLLRWTFARTYGAESVRDAHCFTEVAGSIRLSCLLWPFMGCTSAPPGLQLVFVNRRPALIPFVSTWLHRLAVVFRRLLVQERDTAGTPNPPLVHSYRNGQAPSYVLSIECSAEVVCSVACDTVGYRVFWPDANSAPLGTFQAIRAAVTSFLSLDHSALLKLPPMKTALLFGPCSAAFRSRKAAAAKRVRLPEARPPAMDLSKIRHLEPLMLSSMPRATLRFCCREDSIEESASSAVGRRLGHFVNLSRAMLDTAVVIGQVDCRYITLAMSSADGRRLIAAVDQHAADERVRLEQLYLEVLGHTGTSRNVGIVTLSPMQLCDWNQDDVTALTSFKAEVEAWGFRTRTLRGGRVYLVEAPEVFGGDHGVAALYGLVQELGRVVPRLARPPLLHTVLCSRACHSAIRFGDALTKRQCTTLVAALAKCKFPFQCAHGRPSVVPLLKVQQHMKFPAMAMPSQARLDAVPRI